VNVSSGLGALSDIPSDAYRQQVESAGSLDELRGISFAPNDDGCRSAVEPGYQGIGVPVYRYWRHTGPQAHCVACVTCCRRHIIDAGFWTVDSGICGKVSSACDCCCSDAQGLLLLFAYVLALADTGSARQCSTGQPCCCRRMSGSPAAISPSLPCAPAGAEQVMAVLIDNCRDHTTGMARAMVLDAVANAASRHAEARPADCGANSVC
jgi:hypothetical protein